MSKRVLLIDDDRSAVRSLSLVLRSRGYEVAEAYDGKRGLEQVEAFQPDLIVLDVMMPEKSGLLVCGELKRDQRYRHIPILMLTGVGSALRRFERQEAESGVAGEDNLLKALKQKVQQLRGEGLITPDTFVDKPVDPDQFLAKVEELLHHRAEHSSTGDQPG